MNIPIFYINTVVIPQAEYQPVRPGPHPAEPFPEGELILAVAVKGF